MTFSMELTVEQEQILLTYLVKAKKNSIQDLLSDIVQHQIDSIIQTLSDGKANLIGRKYIASKIEVQKEIDTLLDSVNNIK